MNITGDQYIDSEIYGLKKELETKEHFTDKVVPLIESLKERIFNSQYGAIDGMIYNRKIHIDLNLDNVTVYTLINYDIDTLRDVYYFDPRIKSLRRYRKRIGLIKEDDLVFRY